MSNPLSLGPLKASVRVSEDRIHVHVPAGAGDVWARRPGATWPGSSLGGIEVRAEFDAGGLVDLHAADEDGREVSVDAWEISCFLADLLEPQVPEAHPAWYAAVGQFLDREEPSLGGGSGPRL